MAKQLNVSLAFTADTSKAKKQLQELQSALEKLVTGTNAKTSGFGLTKELAQASAEANKLKILLESSTSSMGTLDLGKFSQGLKKQGMELKDYANILGSLGPEGAKAFASLAQSITTADIPLKQSNKLLQEFATTLKNTVRWQFSSSMLHGFMGAMSGALSYAKDLDKSLNDIRIVTGYNIDQMAQFATEANKAAKALSSTTTNYTNASLIYYQQGLGEEEIAKRTEVTLKMANAAGVSAQTVSDQMTAVWNNFDDGSRSLEYYADVMTALGAATASSTDEISQGLNKFAAVANTVGLSYEYATAALATVTATTRESADVVGTAFKTLFARIQGLNLGETLDDGTTLNKYSSALAKVGIDIKDTNGSMKDMNVILDEMGAKWGNLAKDQQIALAQTVAGVRQYTQLTALMNNWDYFKENVEVAKQSTGTLKQQAEIYAESWEASSKRVKAAAQGIYNQLLNEEFFIGINNILEETLGFISNLIDGLGGLPGVLSMVASWMLKAFGSDIAASMERIVYNIKLTSKTGQEEILAMRKKANQEVRDMYSNSADTTINNPVKVDIINAQTKVQDQLIDKTFELEKAHKSLTEEEQKQAQLLLDQNKALGEQYENIVKIKNEQDTKENKSIRDISTMMKGAKDKDGKSHSIDVKGELNAIKKMQSEYSAGITILEKYQKAAKKALSEKGDTKQQSDIFNKLKEHLALLRENAEKTGQEFTELNDIFNNFDSADDLETALNGMEENLETLGSKAYTTFEDFRQSLQNAGGDMKKLNPHLDAIWESFSKTGELTVEQIQTFANFGIQIDKSGKIIEGFNGKVYTTADTLVAVANIATNVASVFNSIKGLSDIWSNEDLSFGEKMVSTLSTMGMVIGTLISTYENFNTAKLAGVTNDILALAVQQKKNQVDGTAIGLHFSENALQAIENGQLTTEIILKTILNALDLKKIAIYAALALAIGAVVVVAKLLYDAYNKDAQGAKEASEQAEMLTKRYEEAKNAAEELKSTISDWDEAVSALEDLDRNTKEYADALDKANQKAKELIETYGLWNDYHLEDGVIKFNDGVLEGLQQQANDKANKAENQMYGAKIYANQAQVRSETTNQKRDTASFSTGTYTTYQGEQYENYRQLTDDETQYIAEVASNLQDALGGVTPTAEQLQNELIRLSGDGKLGADALQNLSTIVTKDTVGGFISLGDTMSEAAEANLYYAKQLLENTVEKNYGSDINVLATNKDGETDAGRYESILDIYTNKAAQLEADKNNNIAEQYAAVEGTIKDIVDTGDLNNFLKSQDEKDIKAVLGEDYDGKINNDKELGLIYASMLSGNSIDTLTYESGNGVGTVKDSKGNTIVDGVSDEVMRREIAKQIAMEKITADATESVGNNDLDGLKNALTNIIEGGSKAGEKYGADFSSAILDAISNENFETLDFSGLFSELSPEEIAELSGMDKDGILGMLGISEEDLTAAGYNVDTFVAAFSSALENWTYTLDTSALEQKAADLKSIAEDAQFGDIIDQEAFDKLAEAGVNTDKYFTQMEDGSYKLTGAAEEFKRVVEGITIQDYINKLQEFNNAQEYAKSQVGQNYDSDTISNLTNSSVVGDTDLGAARADYINTFEGTDFGFSDDQLSILSKDSSQYTDEDLQALANMMDIVANKSIELQAQMLSTADSMNELNNAVEIASAQGVDVTYDAYSQALLGLASSYESCSEEVERYQKALASGNELQVYQAEAALKASIHIGEAAKKYDLNAKSLKAQTKEIMKANNMTEEQAEQAAQMAVQNQRLNKGLSQLVNGWKDWKKVLASTDETSQDYADTLVELSGAVQELVGWYEDLSLDSTFVEENMGLIEQAAEGNMAAIIALGGEVANYSVAMSALDTTLANGLMADGTINAFQAYYQAMEDATSASDAFISIQAGVQAGFDNIVTNAEALTNGSMDLSQAFGGDAGLQAWVDQLNAYAAATGMTADEMQTMLSSVGVTANVQKDYQEQDMTVPTYREEVTNVNYRKMPLQTIDPYTGDIIEGETMVPEYTKAQVPGEPLETTGYVEVASISMDGIGESPSVEAPKFVGRQAPSTSAVKGGNTRGGGGGSKSKPSKPSKKKDVVQRYATVEKKLEEVREEANKLRSSMNDLYGEELEAAMARLIELENEEKSFLEEKRKLTEEYIEEDLADLQKAAKDVNVEFTFDEDNNIENYEEEMTKLYEELAAMEKAAGDEWDESEQKQIDALNEKIATLQEAIDAYEETLGILDDINAEYDEMEGKPALPYVESDYLDVYYEVTDAIDDVEEAITDAQRELEGLVGQDRIDKLKEIEALEERRLELLRQQHEIAVADAKDRKDALDFMAMQNGVRFEYDDNGNITNYLEEMRKLEDEYERRREEYSAGGLTEAEQEALDALEENMTELKQYVEDYRDAIEQAEDIENELQDAAQGSVADPFVRSDHIDIYKETNDQLDDIEEKMSRIEREADQLTGEARTKKLKELMELEKKRLAILEQQAEIARQDMEDRRAALEEIAARYDLVFEFDENDNIANYNEQLDIMLAKYEEARAAALSDDGLISEAEQATLDEIDQQIQILEEYISAYCDAVEKVEEIEAERDEINSGYVDMDQLDEIGDKLHDINNELDDIEEAINDASKAADRLYGAARIKQMDKTTQMIEKEIDALERKKELQKEIIAEERAEVTEVTSGKAQYDSNGNITNYHDLIDSEKDRIRQLEEDLRAQNNGNLTEADAAYIEDEIAKLERMEEEIEEYEQALEDQEDIENAIDDAFYEWQDLNAEKLSYKLELTLDVNDRELAKIERQISRLEGNFYSRAEALALMVGGGMGGSSKLGELNSQLGELEAHYAEVKRAYEAGEISHAAYVEQTQQLQSEIESTAAEMEALQKQMDSYYKDTLAAARQELNFHISQIEHLTGVLGHYKNILTALGKSKDYEMMGTVLKGQVETLENEVQVAKEAMGMWQQEADEAYAKYQQALASGNQENADMYYQAYKEAINAANEAENKYYQKAQQWAEALKALMQNTLSGLAQDLENALTGGTSFENINNQLKRASSLQEEYLTTTNKIYETTKLMRTAQNEIDKTTNSVAKKKLANFITETKQMQNQNKLSKYELSIQQAKYDLLIAEIALEEARFAKSTVRLRRDAEGNFGYVYTADAEAVANAEQKFEDAQNKLYNIGLDGANKYTEKYQQILSEMYDTLTSLQNKYLQGGFESEEEYNAAVTEAKEYYYEKLKQYSELYSVAINAESGTLTDTLVNNSRIAADAWSTDFADMTQKTEQWMQAVDGYLVEVRAAFVEWERESDRIANETVGTNLTDLKDKVGDIVTESETLTGTITNSVIPAIQSEINEVQKLTDAYANMAGSMQGAIDKAYALSDALQQDIDASVEQEMAKQDQETEVPESNETGESSTTPTEPKQPVPDSENPIETPTGDENNPKDDGPTESESSEECACTETTVQNVEPTCTKSGYYKEICDDCNKIIADERKAALGHDTSGPWKFDKEYHWKECSRCGEISNKAKHTIKDGQCSVCGYKPDSKENGILEVGDTPTYVSGKYFYDSYGTDPAGSRGQGKKVKVTQVIENPKAGQDYPIHVESNDSAYGWLKASQLQGYDTGGYTGEWGPFGKLALLHEKELILNKVDTENFLASLELLDGILSTIDLYAMNSQFNSMMNSPYIPDLGKEALEQMVTIEASFPNATDKQEIEEAFKDLVNLASQYANRK